jgi:hypothetical protein
MGELMSDKDIGVRRLEDPEGQLELAFIDEYLRLHGHDPKTMRALPEAQVLMLLEAASVYAAGKLAEFESRAHYVHEIHGKD